MRIAQLLGLRPSPATSTYCRDLCRNQRSVDLEIWFLIPSTLLAISMNGEFLNQTFAVPQRQAKTLPGVAERKLFRDCGRVFFCGHILEFSCWI